MVHARQAGRIRRCRAHRFRRRAAGAGGAHPERTGPRGGFSRRRFQLVERGGEQRRGSGGAAVGGYLGGTDASDPPAADAHVPEARRAVRPLRSRGYVFFLSSSSQHPAFIVSRSCETKKKRSFFLLLGTPPASVSIAARDERTHTLSPFFPAHLRRTLTHLSDLIDPCGRACLHDAPHLSRTPLISTPRTHGFFLFFSPSLSRSSLLSPLVCAKQTTDSPQWRRGPASKPMLCNACGTRYRRTNNLGPPTPMGRVGAAAAAAVQKKRSPPASPSSLNPAKKARCAPSMGGGLDRFTTGAVRA